MAKMRALDESPVDQDGAGAGDECINQPGQILASGGAGAGDECMEPKNEPVDGDFLAGECGDTMIQSAPKQSDSVTMNVSMNGSGAGGIKDLLGILRNIENSGNNHDADVLVGMGAEENFQDATTRPHPKTSDIEAVTPTGDDLFSKGKEALKVNGGGNPMKESLISKLSQKYETIKGN